MVKIIATIKEKQGIKFDVMIYHYIFLIFLNLAQIYGKMEKSVPKNMWMCWTSL